MLDALSYEFMRYALVAAIFTGLAAPAIGTFLVQRRLALLGDGLGHVALTGVALGLITNVAPILTAVAVAIVGAVLIELLRMYGRTSADVALAMLFYGGLAGGVLLTSLADESVNSLNAYLFGAITTVSTTDLVVVGILGVVVIALSLGLSPQLFAVCQDEEHAKVSGVPTRAYSILIAVLAAVTITVAMKTVGLLLVSALMVVPVAASQQLTRSFRTTHLLAMAIGLFAAVGGLFGSYQLDTPPGPTIVMIALIVFAAAATGGAVLTRTRSRRSRVDWSEEDVMVEAPRNTRQRRAVVAILEDLDGFASAQEIHDILKKRGESVGLSTVYRSLQVLADAAEVDALRNDDGEVLYRQCSAGHHHHLVCRSCGRTVEIEGPSVERWADKIADENGFRDVAHTLEIFGTCSACG
jgi:zinc transport system permease protein